MDLIIVSAMTRVDNVIGCNNQLPWGKRLKNDLKRFKEMTSGLTGHPNCVIMGRKTFESIEKPLEGRLNIVLSKNNMYDLVSRDEDNLVVVDSVEHAIHYLYCIEKTGAFIIGGEQVFKEFLPYCKKMYLTIVDQEFKGDAHFPKFNRDEWSLNFSKFFTEDDLSGEYINLIKKKGG